MLIVATVEAVVIAFLLLVIWTCLRMVQDREVRIRALSRMLDVGPYDSLDLDSVDVEAEP